MKVLTKEEILKYYESLDVYGLPMEGSVDITHTDKDDFKEFLKESSLLSGANIITQKDGMYHMSFKKQINNKLDDDLFFMKYEMDLLKSIGLSVSYGIYINFELLEKLVKDSESKKKDIQHLGIPWHVYNWRRQKGNSKFICIGGISDKHRKILVGKGLIDEFGLPCTSLFEPVQLRDL